MIRTILLTLGILFLAAVPLRAETRLALVIGNSAYRHVTSLPNPAADARLIGHTLASLGFDVTLHTDIELDAMKRAIADFGRKLRAAGPDATALFYYAGHGVQVQGANYMIPVDAQIADEADLYLTSVEMSWILRQMESARNRNSIVILDACRDNPFTAQGLREAGLARMDAPTGSFVAYATGPGEVASDGAGEHSPFTAALARRMVEPGVPVEEMFRTVRGDVLRATGGRQTPWDSSSLIAEFFFAGPAPSAEVDPAEQRLWESVRDSGDLVDLALFLRAYPESTYAPEARRRLVESSTAPAAPAAPKEPAATTAPSAPENETATLAPTPDSPAAAANDMARQEEMIGRAQHSGAAEDYQAYLDAFPDGTFAELARMELAAIAARQAKAEAESEPPAPAMTSEEMIAQIAQETVRFTTPLSVAPDHIRGRSLSEIVTGSPRFPPIEGLPEAYWKNKPCSNCHKWTQKALCDQGQFYLAGGDERIEGKKHPLGREFLYTLRRWAETGCG
ncbi:MAG: peptidase C14, caspase catalytic subunit p20 [Alphaproteobacteria bacterium]|nr:MAG: peptidase C14, caspase catalytic subunit p20 [Alphaproteobacteria bacterium]